MICKFNELYNTGLALLWILFWKNRAEKKMEKEVEINAEDTWALYAYIVR